MIAIKASSNKRASKRYTYLPAARFESQVVGQSIQVRDISKSGVQFFTNAQIPLRTPIVISWQDPGSPKLAPFLMVVRKIDQDRNKIYRYCYGTQFFNLRMETKQQLEQLIQKTKDEEQEANKELLKKITVDRLLQVIREGRSFLQNVLVAQDEVAQSFKRFTREVREYERAAFQATDETSQFIQKMATHNFHCSLLNVAIPLVPKNNAQGFELYKETVKKIELVTDLIGEARNFTASKQAQESYNRVFYNKLELLQTFVETYESDSSGSSSQSEPIKKIVDEYRRTSPKPRR